MRELTLQSRSRREWIDVTDRLGEEARSWKDAAGLWVFCPHTTAGICINEGWDPAVAGDVLRALERMIPDIPFVHAEGNSPAHLLSVLTGTSVLVPLVEGALRLGRWQRVFFCEFDGPRRRALWVRPLA